MEDRPLFLNSETPDPDMPESLHFEALGHSGSEHYMGLETFPNPGCSIVSYYSDEVMSICPITKQPDFYQVTIQLSKPEKCLESKSLKLWFQNLMRSSFVGDTGIFCEALAVHVRDSIAEILDMDEADVVIELVQKARGGIRITAVA